MDKQLARILLLLFAVPCFAQTPNQVQQIKTYYVDAITPGSDSNPGTAASPFATLGKVASVAADGRARVFVKLPNTNWQQLYMPYLNLSALWVGIQGASSTTLYDVTNAAHNATIANGSWSSVQGIPGLVCNGTSTVATYPAFVGNSSFAAYVVAVSNSGGGGGVTWGEGNSADNNPLIWLGVNVNPGAGQAYIRDTSLNGGAVHYPTEPSPDTGLLTPHVWALMRNGTTTGYGILPDYPNTTPSTSAMTGVNITTDRGAICAGTRVSLGPYWPGTLQAVAVYTAYPSAAVANAQYDGLQEFLSQSMNLRMNLRQYNPNNLTAGPIWVRKGGTSGLVAAAEEPAAIYDPINSHCTLVTATNGCVRMMYTSSFSLHYAESVDPNGIAFTDSGSTQIAAHANSSLIHVGSTLYSYSRNTSTNCTDLYTSADTGAPSWTLTKSCAIPLGSAGQIDSADIYNTWVEPNASGTGYEMLYECNGSTAWNGSGYNIGAATSTDLINWTKVSTLPVNNFDVNNPSGPFFKQINGKYYAWMQGPSSPSDIYRSVSNSLSGVFQRYPNASTYPRGSVGEATQVADVMMLDLTAVAGWGSTYMWYGANSGTAFTMKLATTNLTIPQLVLTTEGATTTSP